MTNKIALVTGANRGMGLAASEKLASLNYHVIMVGRKDAELRREVERLKQKKFAVESFVADMTKENDTNHLIEYISKKHGHLDILINNAGIYVEEGNIFSSDPNLMKTTFDTNTMGPYRLMKGLIPLMMKHGYGRVVNVSSGLGAFDGASSSCPAYSVSKCSLNMLTLLFSQAVDGVNVKVNSVCPGWVQTDMGGSQATRSIEEGIAGIIWAAILDESGPNGGFFRDGKAISW